MVGFLSQNNRAFSGLKKVNKTFPEGPEKYCQLQQTNENAEKNLGLWIKANTKDDQQVFVAGFGARVQAYSKDNLRQSILMSLKQELHKKGYFMIFPQIVLT